VGSGSADGQCAQAEAQGGGALLGQGLCRRGSRSGDGHAATAAIAVLRMVLVMGFILCWVWFVWSSSFSHDAVCISLKTNLAFAA
jgi:hypothetical protein